MAANAETLIKQYAIALDNYLCQEEGSDDFDDASIDLQDAKLNLEEFAGENDVQVSGDVDFHDGSVKKMSGKLVSVDFEICYFEAEIGNFAAPFSTMEIEDE